MTSGTQKVIPSEVRGQRAYLLMTMGFSARLPWVMTLLMPFRATIFAFMMGSEMESKSVGQKHVRRSPSH